MKLKKYKVERKLSNKELASILGEKPPIVSLWVNGKTIPPFKKIVKIRKISGKKVDFKDWL